jgi:hypothetical protein
MAFMISNFEVADYDAFKQLFDSDPLGRKQVAQGHRIFRSVENPNELIVGLEFASAEEASSFRNKLLGSEVVENMTMKSGPTVVELADEATYQ